MTRDAATVLPDWTCFNALLSRLLLVTRCVSKGFIGDPSLTGLLIYCILTFVLFDPQP